jgi:glyoxylase-like metal-dependent hydrolase (beta-lactamase superfamily II)
MRTLAVSLGVVAGLVASGSSAAPIRPAPVMTRVADGIYLFQTAPYGEIGLDGNSIAIVSTGGVLVFDTNGTPAAAAAVLAEIRRLTPQPVRFIVNSHWHWDHWYGTEIYQRAFPDVRIIAQDKTRAMMLGPALEFNRPGLERDLPGYITSLEQAITKGEATTPVPASPPQLRERLDQARWFLAQKSGVTHTFPNTTFTDKMTIYLGDREIQVLNYGRAITPGDAFLYLPKERVLITGDLLVNPITFALSCYPTEWLHALERLDVLDTAVIVPGHGDPLHDRVLLHATMDVIRTLLTQGRIMKAKGLDADQAKDAIMPGLSGLVQQITGGNAALADAFRVQLVDWCLHRVYDELNGPLTDAIAAIPVK